MTNSDRDRLEAVLALAESNTRNVDILVGVVTGHQEHITTMLGEIRDIKVEIREIQSEIREMQVTITGLQTENRRILDRLFGQQDSE